MFKSDFHIHTCLVDGKNTPEEMVLGAIEKGLEVLGFSEHAYVPFDEQYSMSVEKHEYYKKEIERLKQKYADRINILCGLEMDYYSEVTTKGYDYIIGSVHYLKLEDGFYSLDMSPDETLRMIREHFGSDVDSYAEWYYEMLSRVCEKTNADILGHADLITKFNDRKQFINTSSDRYVSAWRSALDSLKGKVVMEINTGAISRGYRTTPYPHTDILNYWHSLGGEVVLSGDAHSKEGIAYKFDLAKQVGESAGFKEFGFTDKKGNFYTQF